MLLVVDTQSMETGAQSDSFKDGVKTCRLIVFEHHLVVNTHDRQVVSPTVDVDLLFPGNVLTCPQWSYQFL